MTRYILAIIISIITVLAPRQSPPACVSSGADVAASLASATTCIEIPAGVYSVGVATSGAWLNAAADNLEIRGEGQGVTILRITAPLTLTSDLAVLRLFGVGQHVHDLTIDLGTGHSGTGSLAGISVYGSGAAAYAGRAERATIERVEVTGGYSGNGSGGFGIGTYRLYSDHGGAQYVTIRDCYVHDSPSTGIGVNSSYNLLLHNRIQRVGASFLAHGFYAQGGYNLYDGNIVENASGYSFHGHKQVPSLDASGDRFVNNLSLNPGGGHLVINGALTRSATISNNIFRNTAGRRTPNAVWCNGVPCVIQGNTLEDTFTTNGSGWIEDNAGSVIIGNTLTALTAPDGAVNYALIRVTGTAGATVAGNKLTNAFYGRGMVVQGARHSIQNNTILQTGASAPDAIQLGGDMLLITGNRLESTGGGYTLAVQAPLTNLTFSGNYLKRAGDLCNLSLAGVTGRIFNNQFDGTFRYAGAAPGLIQ